MRKETIKEEAKRLRIMLGIYAVGIVLQSTAVNSATLSESLSAYCVASNCTTLTNFGGTQGYNLGGYSKATFKGTSSTTDALTTNYCECPVDGAYYDKKSRACVNCPNGSISLSRRSTSCTPIVCPEGYVLTKIEDGKCPSGYSLTQVSNGSCPSGYSLKSFTGSWK